MGNGAKRPGRGERLFVSLDPPHEVRQAASLWGREASAGTRGARTVGQDSIHLTLAFLGERSPAERDAILAVLGEVESRGADLETTGPVLLPRHRPRAVAIGVDDPSGSLAAMRRDLLGLLEVAISWTPERSGFLPHLTVVRLGRDSTRLDGAGLPPTPSLAFRASELVLYRSRLDPSGASYEALGLFDLDRSDPPRGGF